MKVDSRGRVRFTYNSVRYEFIKTRFKMYERTYYGRERVINSYDSSWSLYRDMKQPEFREKLRQALNLMYNYNKSSESRDVASGFTTNIFIPKHMRAV